MESRFLGIGIITALLLPTFAEERAGKICVPHGEVPLKKLLWASLCSAGGKELTVSSRHCRVDREAGRHTFDLAQFPRERVERVSVVIIPRPVDWGSWIRKVDTMLNWFNEDKQITIFYHLDTNNVFTFLFIRYLDKLWVFVCIVLVCCPFLS